MFANKEMFRFYLRSTYCSWLSFQEYLALVAANKITK